MTVGDLFSGIGGFSLAFEWAGFDVRWQVEKDDFCRRVLAKHWPNVPKYTDVRDYGTGYQLEPVDVVVGGFPCQPFSSAGKQAGTADDRHLWPEMLRIIAALRPTWVVGENVPGLVTIEQGMAFEQVLSDLEALGYEVGPVIIPACAVDAPHRRDRVWILAHATSERPREEGQHSGGSPKRTCGPGEAPEHVADAAGIRRNGHQAQPGSIGTGEAKGRLFESSGGGSPVPYPHVARSPKREGVGGDTRTQQPPTERSSRAHGGEPGFWIPEPPIRRVLDGTPSELDKARLRAIGNAVVPQIPYVIARAILDYEAQHSGSPA